MRKLRIFQGHSLGNGGTGIQNPELLPCRVPHNTPLLKSLGPPQVFQAKETGEMIMCIGRTRNSDPPNLSETVVRDFSVYWSHLKSF